MYPNYLTKKKLNKLCDNFIKDLNEYECCQYNLFFPEGKINGLSSSHQRLAQPQLQRGWKIMGRDWMVFNQLINQFPGLSAYKTWNGHYLFIEHLFHSRNCTCYIMHIISFNLCSRHSCYYLKCEGKRTLMVFISQLIISMTGI